MPEGQPGGYKMPMSQCKWCKGKDVRFERAAVESAGGTSGSNACSRVGDSIARRAERKLSVRVIARSINCPADLVPGELTKGSATHDKPPAHGVKANLPATHCAKLPFTHALWPSAQGESAVKVANCAFRT